MNFCKSCGAQLNKQSPFCTECGAKIPENELSTQQTRQTNNNIPSFSSLSKRTKIIGASIIGVLILVFGLYKVGEAFSDKERLVNHYIEAIETGDVDYLLHHTSTEDDSNEVTEETITDLLAFIEEFPYEKEYLIAFLDHAKRPSSFTNEDYEVFEDQHFLTVEQRGSKFLFFDNYEFLLHPQPLYLNTNYVDIDYYLNGDAVDADPLDEFTVYLGSHLPGMYDVRGVLSTDFIELDQDLEVPLYHVVYDDMYFDVDYITIYSHYDGAELFINDQNTGQTLESGGESIGPVLQDGSMVFHLELETPFGKIKSDTYVIESQFDYPTALSLSDDQFNEVVDSVHDYLEEWEVAKNNLDMSQMTTVSHTLSDSYSNDMASRIERESYYLGYLLETNFDLDSLSFYESDGNWTVELSVAETWYEGNYNDGRAPTLHEGTENFHYYLIFDENKSSWIVSDVAYNRGFNWNNVLTFDFEIDEAELEEIMGSFHEVSTSDMEELMTMFVSLSVDAVNERDPSINRHLIDPEETSYLKEIADYIEYLESIDLTQEFVHAELIEMEFNEQASSDDYDYFTVITYEEYIIIYSDGSSDLKGFDSEYLVRNTDDGLKIHKLTSTEEVKSEEL